MKILIEKISTPVLFLFFFVIASGCSDSINDNERNKLPDNEYKVTINQGVWGNVWLWEGDFMPPTDNSSGGKVTAVQREIFVYEATNDSLLESSTNPKYFWGTFFTKINSELIATIQSDKDGFFQIKLNPGKYSFFVKVDTFFYSHGWDGEGDIMPATVSTNNVTKRQIDLTYNATY